MQVSRRDATDALYNSFYCGSRDDIITKHYHSALHICCAQYIMIDIDRWNSTMRCDHFHTKAINNIIPVFIWCWSHRLVLESVTLLFCTGHDRWRTIVIDTLASIVVLMMVPIFLRCQQHEHTPNYMVVKSRGGNDRRYNLYQYTKSVQR